jgi:hypothetical protein
LHSGEAEGQPIILAGFRALGRDKEERQQPRETTGTRTGNGFVIHLQSVDLRWKTVTHLLDYRFGKSRNVRFWGNLKEVKKSEGKTRRKEVKEGSKGKK